MSPNIFIESYNEASGRWAIFEDNGVSAWLYLTEKDIPNPIEDCWIYNRIVPPSFVKIKEYQPQPPPASADVTDDRSIYLSPNKKLISFLWSKDGNAVALLYNNTPLGFIVEGRDRGYSKYLLKISPWGNMFDEKLFEKIFA